MLEAQFLGKVGLLKGSWYGVKPEEIIHKDGSN